MNKSVSIVYTILVIIILLCIVGLLAWRTYQSRAIRISGSVTRGNEYTRILDESIYESRDVNEELKVAENLMAEDSLIVAIQVSSKEGGLRLSIVKPSVKDFSQVSIAESNHFDKLFNRILYHKTTTPMTLNEGFEATFVSSVITTPEIRSRLMIVLIVVIGLFLITFILILVNPRTYKKQKEIEPRAEYERSPDFDFPDNGEAGTKHSESSDYISSEADTFETQTDIDDFAPTDRLDENDLLVSRPEYGESVFMENDVDLPELSKIESDKKAGVMHRLGVELESSAASNQDLSLVIISGDSNMDELVHKHYPDPNLVFSIDSEKTAVIETNKDLDSSIFTAKEFLQESKNQMILCGIAARNGRLISSDVLYREAASALLKADRKSRIVGFRSDPGKYRDFIRNQKSS